MEGIESVLSGLAAEIAERVVAPLSGIDLAAASDEQVCSTTVALEQIGRLVDTARVRAAAAVADRSRTERGSEGLAYRLGHRRPSELIEQLTRVSPAEAARRIRIGAAIRPELSFTGELTPATHETVGAAMTAGELGIDAASIIVRCLDQARREGGISLQLEQNIATAEHALVETAATVSADEVAVQARAWREALDPDGAEPRDEALYQKRAFRLGREKNGLFPFSGVANGMEAALLQSAFDEADRPGNRPRFLSEDGASGGAADEIYSDDADGGGAGTGAGGTEDAGGAEDAGDADDAAAVPAGLVDSRSRDQRHYDVFAGLMKAGVRATGTEPGGMRSTALVTAVVTLDNLQSGTGVGWVDGVDEPVSALTLAEATCTDGHALTKIGQNGEVLYHYRSHRYFTAQQMRALAVRDGGCVWPGCHAPAAWCDGHHVEEFVADQGDTNIDNAVLLCQYHHRMLHHSDFTMKMIRGRPHLRPPVFLEPSQQWIPLGKARFGIGKTLVRQLL